MNMLVIFSFLIVTVVAAPAEKAVDYGALNKELDSILQDSQNINKMTPGELIALSARVDGTLKRLETIAEKRLGLHLNSNTLKRVDRSPQETQPEEETTTAGQGLLGGLGGAANLLQMLSQMFASLGQSQQNQPEEKQD